MRGSNSDIESESDDESTVSTVHVDPLNILQSLSILSTIKYPSINQAMTLLLSGISIKNANSPEEISTTTRKRPSNETDGDSERQRAAKARKIAEGIKCRVNKKECKSSKNKVTWTCYICYETFHNQSNLNRHINNTNIHPSKYCRVVNRDGRQRFRCGLCGNTLSNKGNVNRHIKLSHSKVEKRKRNSKDFKVNVAHTEHKPEKQQLEKDIKGPDMFVCTECEVATSEIDRAVEHAQFHQLPGYDPCPRTCEICNFTFEEDKFREHLSVHEATNEFIIRYSPLKLLNSKWSDMFQCIDGNLVNRMKSSSIYEHTRKVKMNTDDSDDSSGTAIYQCEMCETFVRPVEVEDHCNKEKTCVENMSEFNICDDCDRFFFTSEALSEHEKEEKEGIRFKTVTFNGVKDLPMNRALRNIKNNSQAIVVERASSSTVEPEKEIQQSNRTEKEKKIVILEDRPVTVTQFCQDCGDFIPFSDIKTHEVTHRYKQFSAIEDEENQSTDEEVSQEQNVSNETDNAPDGIHEEVENRDENGMDSVNSISGHVLQSTEIPDEDNMQEDDEEQIIHNTTVSINQNTNENVVQKPNCSKNNYEGSTVSGNNPKEVAGSHKHIMDHLNSTSYRSFELNAQLQKENIQRDDEERIADTTVQIDNSKSKLDIAPANQRIIIGLDGDQSFTVFEDELRQNLQENLKIFFNNYSTKQSNVINETIENTYVSEYKHDSEPNCRVSTPSSSSDINKASQEDEIVDDKSKIERIDINWMNKQSNKTIDIIDLTGDDDENEEHTTESNSESTAMMQRELSDDLDEESAAERRVFLEEERQIREILSRRD